MIFRMLSLRLVKTVVDEMEDKGWDGYIKASRHEAKERLKMLINC